MTLGMILITVILAGLVVWSHCRMIRSLHRTVLNVGAAVDTVHQIASLRKSRWSEGGAPMRLPFVVRAKAAQGVELESVFSCPEAEVHLLHLKAGSVLPGHLHEDSIEIFFPVEGDWTLEIEGENAGEFTGGSRCVGVARSGRPHAIHAVTDAAILAIIVPPVFLGVNDVLHG